MTGALAPFFHYYGSKWRMAPHYPAPSCGQIVEPFAGSAGYSLHHHDRDVLLRDTDENIVRTWSYLIQASETELLGLPDLEQGQTVDDLDVPTDARLLIGWWLNTATSAPRKTPSKWMRARSSSQLFWGHRVRERLARQVRHIRHWRVELGSYADCPNSTATWFIDPPYQVAGSHYRHSKVDYAALAAWCRSRVGQVIVCENAGAAWLPFRTLGSFHATTLKNGPKRSDEVFWVNDHLDGVDL